MSATITVTTTDGNKTATCTVEVKAATPTDYTTGRHLLNLAGPDNGIFETKLSKDEGSGYKSTYFKLSSSSTDGTDYLFINLNLQKDKIIKISGKGQTANKEESNRSATIGISVTKESSGSVNGLPDSFVFNQPDGEISFAKTYTVTKEGTIVLQLNRTDGNTGCEFTEFVVEILDTLPTEYTVTFDANNVSNASGIPAAQTVTKGGKATEPTTAPTASGWKFEGWYKEAACTNKFNFDTDTINENTTFYAKWTANGGGGTGGTTQITQSKKTWEATSANATLIEGKDGANTVFKVTTVSALTLSEDNKCGVAAVSGNVLKFELVAGYSYSITVTANFQGNGRVLTFNEQTTGRGDKSTRTEKAMTHIWTIEVTGEGRTLYLTTNDTDNGGVYLREVTVVATKI